MKKQFWIFVAGVLCCSIGCAQSRAIAIGQVAPLSGPAASIGLPLTQAAHAYFNRVNAEGGINCHRIDLVDRDDGFDPRRTVDHVQSLLDEKPVVALLNIVGAPNNGDLITQNLLGKNDISVVGAFTGATSVRAKKSPLMFFVRASVADEAKKMVMQVRSLGMTSIALVYANDAFGKDAKAHVESALVATGSQLVGAASYEPGTADSSGAATALRKLNPQAILIFATGPATAKFVTEYRRTGGGGLLIANSSTSPDVLARLAGHSAGGVGLAQVVPSLSRTSIPVVKEYLDTLQRFGEKDWKPSPYGLEGFIASKLLAEAIRRAGPSPSRTTVTRALALLDRFDAGGLVLDYSNGSREGLRSVDVGILSATSGRLVN